MKTTLNISPNVYQDAVTWCRENRCSLDKLVTELLIVWKAERNAPPKNVRPLSQGGLVLIER